MSTPVQYRPPAAAPTTISQATAVEQSRAVAQVQAQIVVAQNCPRNIQRATAEMQEVCRTLAMANQAFYQVPNRGNGPSVHLMRELARIWGNIEHGSKELARNENGSEIEAFAWDMQTNSRTSRTYVVPHERMKGRDREKLTNLGDITNNNNNVAARAVRECISNVLPKWFTEEAQNICRQTLEHGEGKPLAQRVSEMLAGFKGIGVTESQIEAKLGKKRGQWDAGDVAQMGITYTSITRDGYDKDELFPPVEGVSEEAIARSSARRAKPEPAPEPQAGEVMMATKTQLAKIKQIRSAQGYDGDDEGWYIVVSGIAGQPIGSESDITEAGAAAIIAEYQQDDKR
ncbi:uncharacterized protein RMCC_5820 [Mycolicibacterium canariasense]|uniref:Uncharacterized protein n=1 Tax=Mycolicibacterium canariasense TaxID=228230 RepID=A0A124E347_MYCCR|nr:hypothetical protein [Mycolicibacterium canariasense]MCV7210197.1 hypothetical protein [Mycolicibacterium canariasense]ORU98468.1 hypothetical protein AWB94_28405 [Mycolicibacterium canariasense]GAS98855.1 uncharacterized protein RMCC_5820 [Mycolicibacterium canariasense]